MRIISLRENPEILDSAIHYIQKSWPEISGVIYEDCLRNCIDAALPLPQWYLLEKDGSFIGCAGLITNDFISRMDLYPWVCAMFVDEAHRGNAYGALLLEKAKADAKAAGFLKIYLCTDLEGYYEKYGFTYLAQGHHPWDATSRIYQSHV